MTHYNHILILVDLTPNSVPIIERAKAIAGPAATLSLLNVVEYVPLEPMGETVLSTVEIEKELVSHAAEKLHALAQQQGLAHCEQLVVSGNIKAEIQLRAQQLKADLIVVGNHERHGLRALFNFTEDAVLHTAPCDVLAVHLSHPSAK